MTNFSKVPRRKLADEVLEQLQRKIFSGEYKVGDKLPSEPQLMEELGVGRSTLREVIKILAHAGILEVRQGHGTHIISNSPVQNSLEKNLKDANKAHLLEARAMIDKEVTSLAVKRRNDDDLLQMKTYLDKRKNALKEGQYAEYLEADISFHLSIAKASKNPILIDLYQSFIPVLRQDLSKLIMNTSNYQDNSDIHEKLYLAILNQNEEDAIKYAMKNMEPL
ncbi:MULTISPECIES: FadR/GntR family transcriptional regulator [unclassified Bacillus (in: firmicutes)]|uniref:FadR/GntR family transcriptional regulator n=1 Tax=Bacillaceae TaxID=186817 RepID=UPI000BF16447|nr:MULTISPECIES: FadR/GntR family transcriptional regulator [unclassified Bacillus (in: firmicutes)]PEJ59025.1 GntR family transcriptional regulator [Bacillus sp. AFS002410]PEK99011.1 GntR family transcriptional regulator [Bacillus sp. AFS017336]QKE72258.1 FadR family transcriptional regulator [Arthrobacter citreus]